MKRIVLGALALSLLSGAAFAQSSPYALRPEALAIGSGTKTTAATAGAATLNKLSGKITTEALTTAAGASYTLTITNSLITAADIPFASVAFGTNTTGNTVISRVTPGAGSLTIVIRNIDAAVAFNGTLVVSFGTLKN